MDVLKDNYWIDVEDDNDGTILPECDVVETWHELFNSSYESMYILQVMLQH